MLDDEFEFCKQRKRRVFQIFGKANVFTFFIRQIKLDILLCKTGCPTVCVTGAGVGVDSAWEQKKFEARKMLAVGRADSPASSARGVGQCMPCHAPNFSRIMLTR